MDISKKPYEISIWEDKASIHPTTNKRFFEESLIATIGSDTMDTPIRAFNPLLNLNINGTSTLTFQIFSIYYDEEKDEEVENPFLKLLVNERKLKLRYDNGNRKWFDFIIKDIQEDSTTNTFSYTAYDLHIEELSKTGFQMEFNPELKNNQGTVVELGERVLKGSDWKVRPNVSDIIRQTIKEPLYEIVLNQDIVAYNMIGNEPITILSGNTIYGFYTSIMEKNPYFQFLYHTTNGYEVDDDRIVLNAPTGSNYYIDSVTYRDGTYGPVPSFSTSNAPPIAELYRGERLVRQQSIVYDPKIEKYVNVYKSGSTTIYGLEETEYIGATITKNFISNNEEFVTTHGWIPSTNTTIKDIIYPPITPTLDIQTTNFTPYLQFKFANSNAMLMNTGIQDNRAYINNIAKGEKYVLRFKYKMGATPSITPTGDKRLIGIVGAYTLDSNGNYQITRTYITFSPASTVVDGDTGFSYIIGTASNALSLSEMVNGRIGFFLRPGATSVDETYWLENLELFKYNTGNNGKMVVPGVPPEGIIKTIYSYYDPSSTYESLEDIQFIYRGDTPSPSYEKSYNPNFEKVRSITAAESNRYNLLQTLAETFECWVKFEIEYDEATGKMLREADGRLKKWISFHHFIGQDNQVGFHYGINVNAISRQILSDQIVTKLIVKNNSNQFAEDGFCSIARAPENPPKENFLFNFKYYIQQGLLSYAEVQNDLYSNFGSWIGYFAKLRTINQNRENLIKKYSLLSVEATKLESDYQTYTLVKNEANEQVLFLKAELHQYTGLSYESLLSGTEAAKLKLEEPKVKEIIKELETHSNISKKYTPLSTIYKDNLEAINAELKDITAQLEVDRASKDALDKEFYDKYSTFIKEGSWISEDYVDDNLYYLDAESVLYTSSSPQISYTINVLELSALEEYKAYNFNLGDKTYIEHTEFFGWVFGPNGEKTPYREEIVVSQVSYNLDDPSQNQITVQNYKNQFEELFQRITATVQAVQYQTGALARVAGIVETDGTIKTNTLQNSLAYNQFLISNAADQSVQWDQSGITVTNLRKPNEVLRLVSGGILLTTDGGLSWNYGMTGAGMNADFITAGQIDASRINIVGGAFSAFRWDHTGLNAYGLTRDETGTPLWFNFNEFVRFDQFGLYGFHGEDSFVPSTEGDIWDDPGTKFALTWKGFLLRSGKEDDGYLLLDSERDFVVVDGDETERVRIGNLNPPQLTPRYGIQLKNSNNEVVLESSDSGSLFLRELLSIGPNSYTPRTQLGVIETIEGVSKIFAIKDTFEEEQLAMYDDGRLVAKNGEFHGGIFADYGQIGNMTIAQYEQSLEKFLVRANTEIFRVIPAQGATPEEINPTSIDIEVDYENIGSVNESAITWSYSTDFETWTPLGLTGKNITLSYADHKTKFDATGAIIVRASYNSRFSFVNLSRVMDGTIGKDGVGIESTSIRYQAGTSGTIAPEGMWLTTIPDVEANEYLWTRVIISYTDGDSTTSYSVGKMGAQGPQGAKGDKGDQGKGIANALVEYKASSSGTTPPTGTWSTTVPVVTENQYLWTRTTITYTDSQITEAFSVGKMGAQGPQGDQGIQGPAGTTTYTWVKYADTDTGSGMSDTPAGKKYIGLAFNKITPTESQTASDYTWSLMPQNIEIGGRNLISNHSDAWESGWLITTSGAEMVAAGRIRTRDYIPVTPLEPYVFTSTHNAKEGVYGIVHFYDIDNAWISAWYLGTASGKPMGKTFVLSGIAPANASKMRLALMSQQVAVTMNELNDSLFVKFEKGNIATDWTPAPEDIDAAIKDVESATYRIEANTAVIIRYKERADTSTPASPTYATQVSPQIYEARVYKKGIISPTTNYILDFQIYTRPNESAVDLAWVSIEELKNPPYSFITPNTSTNVWNFNIEGLLDYDDPNASYLVKQTKNLIINGDYFRIVVKSLDGEIQTTRAVEVRDAVGDDLASFGVLAGKIAMAVHNTKLDFSLDGLNIYNGGLSIFRENDKVFYADEFGNLVVKGVIEAEGGYFAGELRAATGRFSGNVTIEQGSITGDLGVSGLLDLGGIKLDGRNPEASGERRGIYSTNYIEGEEGFYISPDGEVSVNRISLGSNASIQKYIRLGDAWIINPTSHDLFTSQESTDSLLESGDFIVLNRDVSGEKTRLLSIKDNGRIKLGLADSSLTIDAATASIFSGNYDNGIGTGWSITPTEATFNNIVARGSIRASVLEYAEVQAVAGIMIVRPSSIIKSARKGGNNNVFVTLMNRNGFYSGDYCKLQITGSGLSTNVYKIALPSGASPVLDLGNGSPLGDDGTEIELLESSEISDVVDSLVGRPLIDFGVDGSIGIGINSSSNSSLIAPSAVSVFQTKINSETVSLDTKIVLGQIPDRAEFGNLRGTYGLYADNVLVKGSLVAQGEIQGKTYYSGISSSLLYQSDDDVDANQLNTTSPILIWAGAGGATTEEVINSLFKVYADGSFFAGKGFFKGSIITDAHITAAEIRTAVIKGWDRDSDLEGEGEAAALTIKDAYIGIDFTDGETSKFKLKEDLMTVNTEMKLGSGYRFDSSSPFNTTRLFVYDSNADSTIAITPSRIGFTQGRYQENITFNSFIDYNEGLNLYDSSGQETLMAKFKPTATRIYNNTELTQNLVLGDQMEFKQIRNGSNEVIGYDLFVREPN